MINVILQSLGLDLAIPLSRSCQQYWLCKSLSKHTNRFKRYMEVQFHFFQNLNLGNPKCHLTISLATSYQYQCVCKISSQYSSQLKRYGHFIFFRIRSSAKLRPIKTNVSLQSLGLDLVNIYVYAKVYQNIPKFKRQGCFHCFRIRHSAKLDR